MAQQPPVGQGLLIFEASRSHSDTPHWVGILWTSDQPDGAISIWQNSTLNNRQVSIPAAGFEPTVPASERTQTHTLDHPTAVTGTCMNIDNNWKQG